MRAWHIEPQGDTSLIIRLGEGIDTDTCRRCADIAGQLREAALPGMTDIVPAFNSITLHVAPDQIGTALFWTDTLDRLNDQIAHALAQPLVKQPSRIIDIPVCYGGEYGPDLFELAQQCDQDEQVLIETHSGTRVWVLMLGFAPGAPYVGVHDPLFDLPRRATPRTRVPRGSVAVAARQTIIYPQDSPGGWHIIGRTPLRMFDPMRASPALLAPGDCLRFVPISPTDFLHWRETS